MSASRRRTGRPRADLEREVDAGLWDNAGVYPDDVWEVLEEHRRERIQEARAEEAGHRHVPRRAPRPPEPRSLRELRKVLASEVRIRPVRFLVPGRVPRGALTLVAGDPGLGKSQWTCSISAGVSNGTLVREPGRVLMANAEDAPSTVIVPRLHAAGANLELVEFLTVLDDDAEREFTLPDDLDLLTEDIARLGAQLVVLDPLNAFLGGQVDSWKDQQVRRALAPLSRLATNLNIAIIVVAHLTKGATTDPLYRV
jgi:predicted ATP-dependent serine protease